MGCRPGANSGFSSYVNTLKPIPPNRDIVVLGRKVDRYVAW